MRLVKDKCKDCKHGTKDFWCAECLSQHPKFFRAAADLYYWYETGADNFTACLYQLMMKADDSNKRRFRKAWPFEAAAFKLWYESETPKHFYERFSVP